MIRTLMILMTRIKVIKYTNTHIQKAVGYDKRLETFQYLPET